MFGYVRISKRELDETDFKKFQSYYCGLCKAIGKYSQAARLGLSYDMTFLVILLSAVSENKETNRKFRCIFKIFKQENATDVDTITDYVAQMSILLVYEKFKDDMRDEKSVKALFGKLAYLRAVKKIKQKECEISALLEKMTKLEKENCGEPDEIADCFAKICEIVFTPYFVTDEDTRRILAWMGYNIGRWIYLIDAFDDLEKDLKTNSYNPLAKKYSDKKSAAEIEKTLTYTLANIAAAYDLLNINKNDGIIKNILYAGMSGMQNKVLNLREEKNESLRGSRCKSE